MKAITIVGLMALVGAAAGGAYLLTRKKRRVIMPTTQAPQASTPWTFQLPQLSTSYQKPDTAAAPVQTSRAATPAAPQSTPYYTGIDSVIKAFSTSSQQPPADNYVMADRRNQPAKPSEPESTNFLDSIIQSFQPKKPISLLRPPEPRSPVGVPIREPSVLDSILSAFGSAPAPTPTRSNIPTSTVQERRTLFTPMPTARPAVSAPAFDDSPLSIIESAVKAVVEPIARIVEPMEVVSTSAPAGLTPSPLSKFEKDVGFTSAFTTGDGKRWLKDFRGGQYFSDEFHRSAAAVADAAARSKRDGKSYSPG